MKFDDNNAILGEFLSGHGCLTPQRSFDVGTEVGEWRITGFLGRGGSSEVYCVRHAVTGESAALKVLHRKESRHVERFSREARILGEMTSCRFPRLYCKGVFSGRPYIVIELLEPKPLPSKDRVKYVLAGDAYLNFADIDTCPPGVRLDEFIEVAEGLEVIRTNLHRNACNNDLRFGGPTTWERLVGEKNIEYFDEDFREKNKSHH